MLSLHVIYLYRLVVGFSVCTSHSSKDESGAFSVTTESEVEISSAFLFLYGSDNLNVLEYVANEECCDLETTKPFSSFLQKSLLRRVSHFGNPQSKEKLLPPYRSMASSFVVNFYLLSSFL